MIVFSVSVNPFHSDALLLEMNLSMIVHGWCQNGFVRGLG